MQMQHQGLVGGAAMSVILKPTANVVTILEARQMIDGEYDCDDLQVAADYLRDAGFDMASRFLLEASGRLVRTDLAGWYPSSGKKWHYYEDGLGERGGNSVSLCGQIVCRRVRQNHPDLQHSLRCLSCAAALNKPLTPDPGPKFDRRQQPLFQP